MQGFGDGQQRLLPQLKSIQQLKTIPCQHCFPPSTPESRFPDFGFFLRSPPKELTGTPSYFNVRSRD